MRDINDGNKLLTSLLYDGATGDGPGKLWQAIQYNRISLPWVDYGPDSNPSITVTETYEYEGKAGAVSNRHTLIEGLGLGAADPEFDVSWVWDDLGNVSELTYPTCYNANCTATVSPGRAVDSTYDEGLLADVVGWMDDPIVYHANGAFDEIAHANGVTDHQGLDPNVKSRPYRLYTAGATNGQGGGANFDSGVMSYDGSGNIVEMDDAPNFVDTFTYDKVSRLVGSSVRGCQDAFTYNVYGSLTQKTSTCGTSNNLPVDYATNRLTNGAYDAAGNVTGWMGDSYDWNPLDRLERMTNRWYHAYTASGERIVTIDWQGGVLTREATFTLRGLGNEVLSRFQMTGIDEYQAWSRERDYIWAGSRLLASDDESSGSAGVIHYHLDHLGTPRLLTDSSGVKISNHDYLPYGEEITSPGTEVMKFTGHERDLDTGQDYMHARYYRHLMGRFLSVDPVLGSLDSPQSWNAYAYVRGAPLSFTDPEGLQEEGSGKRPGELMEESLRDSLKAAKIACIILRLKACSSTASGWEAWIALVEAWERSKQDPGAPPPPSWEVEVERAYDLPEGALEGGYGEAIDVVDSPKNPTDERSYFCSAADGRCFALKIWDDDGNISSEEAQNWLADRQEEIDVVGSMNDLYRGSCLLNPNLCLTRPSGWFYLATLGGSGMNWLVIYAY